MSVTETGTAPEQTAEQLFTTLRRLRADGKLALRLNYKKLSQMDSPVGSEADGNIWAYGGLALTIAVWWLRGWQVGVGVALVGVLAYFTLGRVYRHHRIRHRVENKALVELALWRQLWKFGGIALMASAGEECAAPQGNWMALVRKLSS